jgi:hypothetical protein
MNGSEIGMALKPLNYGLFFAAGWPIKNYLSGG